jgi:hypothetical protein
VESWLISRAQQEFKLTRDLQPRACSTASQAALQIVAYLYAGSVRPNSPWNDKTPSKLTRNEAIRQRFLAGEAVADLAVAFGVSTQRVHQVIRQLRK